jgi:hypothetical protein
MGDESNVQKNQNEEEAADVAAVTPSIPKRDDTAAKLSKDKQSHLSILQEHVNPRFLYLRAFWKD